MTPSLSLPRKFYIIVMNELLFEKYHDIKKKNLSLGAQARAACIANILNN
jgi:hypothetical protein